MNRPTTYKEALINAPMSKPGYNTLLLHRGNETGIQMRTQTTGRANSRVLREKSTGVQEVQKHKEKRTPLQNN
jgi:hypothetical protein